MAHSFIGVLLYNVIIFYHCNEAVSKPILPFYSKMKCQFVARALLPRTLYSINVELMKIWNAIEQRREECAAIECGMHWRGRGWRGQRRYMEKMCPSYARYTRKCTEIRCVMGNEMTISIMIGEGGECGESAIHSHSLSLSRTLSRHTCMYELG